MIWAGRVLNVTVSVVVLGALAVAVPNPAHADPTVNCEPYGPSTPNLAVAQMVYETALSLGASAKVQLSSFEAALVESNMNNCDNGDRDSVGVFQQRASWGTYEQRTEVRHASRSFLTRAIAREDSYSTAGRLAQAVQISAFPARYDAREAQAAALLAQVAAMSGLADGAFVTYQGNAYRIAGGAPIYIGSWANVGGQPGGTIELTDAQWAALATYPVDGTYIRASAPEDPEDGSVFRIAGGAPIYVPEWTALGGDPGNVVAVDIIAVREAGSAGPKAHLRHKPADGTVLSAAGVKYVVKSGAPIARATSATGTAVHPEAIAHAGGAGVWSHLAAPPSGTVAEQAQAAVPGRASTLRVAYPKRRTAALTWKVPAQATSCRARLSRRNSQLRWNAWTTMSQPSARYQGLSKRSTYRFQVECAGAGGTGPRATLKFVQRR